MKALENTAENNAKVSALKTIKETQWVGELTHDTIDKCLTAINLFQGTNSGSYSPSAIRLSGVQGIFMVNEDGGLNFEARIIKVSDNKYRMEHLSNSGYDVFENKYIEILEA